MTRVRWFACLNVCSCTCTTYTDKSVLTTKLAYLLTLLYVGPLFCTDIHTYGVLSTFIVSIPWVGAFLRQNIIGDNKTKIGVINLSPWQHWIL
jgi:hypothetical protein